MERKDFLKIMGRLEAAYPARFEKMDGEKRLEFYRTWFEMLKDVDRVKLWNAVGDFIKTSKFFPTIAELREKAERTSGMVGEDLFSSFAAYYPGYDRERDGQAREFFMEKAGGLKEDEKKKLSESVKASILGYVRQCEAEPPVRIMSLQEFLERLEL